MSSRIRRTLSAQGLGLWNRPDVAFVLRATIWVAVIFGALRLAPVEHNLLLPLAEVQGRIAFWLASAPAGAVVVDRSCTAADALALCLGAILAFPAPWLRRIAGAAVGFALLQTANIGRIAHLASVVDQPQYFTRLHLVIWPALLVLLSVTYVAIWMRRSGWQEATGSSAVTNERPHLAPWPFLGLSVLLVAVYYALYPWLLASPLLFSVADLAASTAGVVMRLLGLTAAVDARILRTEYGAWIVTPECVITPLIPLFLAAVLAGRRRGWRRLAALSAAIPIFLFLATARLLVLALPAALVGSHQVAIHAFYQVLLAVALVVAAAGATGGRAARIVSSITCAVAVGVPIGLADQRILAPALARLGEALHLGHAWVDPQGAVDLALGFQAALLVGLALALRIAIVRALAGGLMLLALGQLALRVGVGELASHVTSELPVVAIRAWSIAAPLALVWLLKRRALGAQDDLRFWQEVGASFPDLGGARSTTLYRRDEEQLLRDHLSPLAGRRILKTDLWDEARNTRILCWAAAEGAEAWGIDISLPTLRAAAAEFRKRDLPLRAVAADVRALPFAPASFDLAYSMGTVEHFAETETAVAEIGRVVRPGGRAIIGVPNRHDPFLRPLLVAVLYRLGLYAYGLEKSYSRTSLRALCRRAGFDVVADAGILFLPGALRMADLLCWTRVRPLARLTALLVAPFDWVSRRFPGLRRHGYLIAAVGARPKDQPPIDSPRRV